MPHTMSDIPHVCLEKRFRVLLIRIQRYKKDQPQAGKILSCVNYHGICWNANRQNIQKQEQMIGLNYQGIAIRKIL